MCAIKNVKAMLYCQWNIEQPSFVILLTTLIETNIHRSTLFWGVNIYKGLHCKDILGMHNKPSSWWGKWCLHEDFNWMFTLVSYVFLLEWIGVKVWAMSYHWSTMVIVSSQSQWVFCRPKDLQSQILRQQLLCGLDYDWVICFRCN